MWEFDLFVLEFWGLNSGLCICRRCTTWTTPPAFFALVIFELGCNLLSKTTWTEILLFYSSCCSWNDRHTPPHPTFSHWDGVLWTSLPGLTWSHSPPALSLTCIWVDRHVLPCPAIGWDLVLQIFCLGWLWTEILLLSASHVARITGVSHRYPAGTGFIFNDLDIHMSIGDFW
jgi:hypothetical protein